MKIGQTVYGFSHSPGAWASIVPFEARVVSHDESGYALWGILPDHNGEQWEKEGLFFVSRSDTKIPIYSLKETRDREFNNKKRKLGNSK